MSEPRFKHLILTSGVHAPVVDPAQYQPTRDQRRYFVLDRRYTAFDGIFTRVYSDRDERVLQELICGPLKGTR